MYRVDLFISCTTKWKHRFYLGSSHAISGLISPQVRSEGFSRHFVVRHTKWKYHFYLCLQKQHQSVVYLLIVRSSRQLTLWVLLRWITISIRRYERWNAKKYLSQHTNLKKGLYLSYLYNHKYKVYYPHLLHIPSSLYVLRGCKKKKEKKK